MSNDNFVLASIQGIRAEETAAKIDYGLPTALGLGNIVAMRIEIESWRPLEEEITRLPLLKEWAAWLARGKGLAQPASTLDRVFAAGVGEEMRGAIEALERNQDRPALKIQVAYSMPGLAALQRKQGVDAPAGTDPTGTILEIACELMDLSPALLADELFTVRRFPLRLAEGHHERDGGRGPVRGAIAAGHQTAGDNLQDRSAIYRGSAEVPSRGTVVLSVIVGSDGNVQDTKIVKSLSPDLDGRPSRPSAIGSSGPGERREAHHRQRTDPDQFPASGQTASQHPLILNLEIAHFIGTRLLVIAKRS